MRPWLVPNLVSLDAPVVAVVWLWFFSLVEGVRTGEPIYAAVFLTVWAVYVADRLVDVWRTRGRGGADGGVADGVGPPETARLRFHRRWWPVMAGVFVGASLGAAWLVLFRVPVMLAEAGWYASVLVWLYFLQNLAHGSRWLRGGVMLIIAAVLALWVFRFPLPEWFRWAYVIACAAMVALTVQDDRVGRFRLLPKELLCGLTFAVGVTLPVYRFSSTDAREMLFSAPVYMFAVLCTLNCLAIAIRERDADARFDREALPQRSADVEPLFPWLCVGLVGWAGWSLGGGGLGHRWPLAVAVAGAGALLFVLFLIRHRTSADAFRVLADVVLLTPLPVALFLR